MTKKTLVITLAILLAWLCGCSPTTRQGIGKGIEAILEGVSEGLSEEASKSPPVEQTPSYSEQRTQERSEAPRPWTSAEKQAWRYFVNGVWADFESTKIGLRRCPEGFETNPELGFRPTDESINRFAKKVIRSVWERCNRHPENRMYELRKLGDRYR